MPEVRFKGFSGDWEEKTLGDVSKVYDGTHQTPQYTNSGIRFISVENINDIYNSSKYISQEDFENHFKIKAKKGDIFMTRITAGVIGSTAIMQNDIPLAYYVSLALLKPNFNLIETLFLNANMQSSIFKKELNKRIIHTAFPKKINLGDIGECKISYTLLEEQQKIGTFFKQLDRTIALQRQLVEQQQQYKKAMLQKMYPQKGERTPKIRFDGFSGDWEEKELNEIASIVGGGTPSTSNLNYWNGDIDWYSPVEIGKKIYVSESQKKITPLGLKKSSATVLPANRTILFTSRAGIGDMAILKKDGATNQGFQSLVVKENNDVYFVYSMGGQIKKYALKNASGSTFLEISGKNLGKMKTLYPNFLEQQKIGTFFKQLDDTITLHEKKLEDYQQLKKALLKRMFV